MSTPRVAPLPIKPAHALEEQQPEHRWLVEQLWGEQAVGIIGGEPKCGKSFLALTLAVAVASGRPCLGRFSVKGKGKVLVFPAEDSLQVVKRRLEGIASSQGLSLARLPLFAITAPVLKLDTQSDQQRLRETVARLKPTLLILDPFVRLHSIDENASSEVAALLDYLRKLQRSFGVAVALVHHARKGARTARAGQALRGSSEFHAWGDSNLYLRRDGAERIMLTVEHRAEAAPEPLPLEIATDTPEYPRLRLLNPNTIAAPLPQKLTASQKIITTLSSAAKPMTITELRAAVTLRNATVSQTLDALSEQGVIRKHNGFYELIASVTP